MSAASSSELLRRIREHRETLLPLIALPAASKSIFGRTLAAVFAYLNIGDTATRIGVGRDRLNSILARIDEGLTRGVDPAEILLFREPTTGPKRKYSDATLKVVLQGSGGDGKRKPVKQAAKELGVDPATVVRARARLRQFLQG